MTPREMKLELGTLVLECAELEKSAIALEKEENFLYDDHRWPRDPEADKVIDKAARKTYRAYSRLRKAREKLWKKAATYSKKIGGKNGK